MDAKQRTAVAAIAMTIAVPMEGLRQWAYKDPIGLPTICFGSTKGVKMGDYRTLGECQALLKGEMYATVQAVDSCRPGLPINVLAAFSDAAYNIGEHIACNGSRSTAARYLAARDYEAACRELLKWDKARVAGVLVALPGLTNRRQLEMELCLTP
jgi:lysozyme